MEPYERLKQVDLFTDLSDDDLRRICKGVLEVNLESGEVLFEEGDPGDQAYVVLAGTVDIVKATEGREALVAVREPGSVIGEMALLQEAPRIATVRARTDAQLLVISKATLDELLESSPSAARAMFRSLLARMRETSDRLRHSERMAQLGTLTAGVAHELNNPAAAATRAAQRLREELETYTALAAQPPEDGGVARRGALALAVDRVAAGDELDALARSGAEMAVEAWLDERGVEEPWLLAPELVGAGIDAGLLDQLGPEVTGPALADAARFLVASSVIRGLVADIAASTARLSEIVRSLKSYAYLDRAPAQDVDLVQGLEDTLLMLAHKTKHVRIQREFDPDLPTIAAYGSELNQVWTNLIDNACDALAEVTDRTPTLTLRAFPAGADVIVEIEDNGPGIPPDLQPRIFDAFVTTKPPGQGTGLGLQISYRIVALEHRGELMVDSEPGRTTFRVVLPARLHEPAGSTPANEGGAP
ncbi:sensor histidine kinase [Nitriliruptor alkaliphilus]|uniref:sensor histidine kinase n=1 Tax=Nitriliruptor alkaliphilus TaxID=427918 RepID=UPI00069617AA|nr:cyclic nucleotide-binding domain-containing protein [Nitriliruptor alkaliphilus]